MAEDLSIIGAHWLADSRSGVGTQNDEPSSGMGSHAQDRREQTALVRVADGTA